MTDIGNTACPNGETVKELHDRVISTVLKIAEENDGKTVVIVTHATPIRALCCWIRRLPVWEMKNVFWVSNASTTVLQINKELVSLVQENICEYLSDMQTRFPANV